MGDDDDSTINKDAKMKGTATMRWVRGYDETRRDETRRDYDDTMQRTATTRRARMTTRRDKEMQRKERNARGDNAT
jgi:hypothetical protein